MNIRTCNSFVYQARAYIKRLESCFSEDTLASVQRLAEALRQAWVDGRNVYICGNGGSAANAMHLANDFHYGIGASGASPRLPGLRVEALSANPSVITCLSNDTGYENIYSHQLQVKGRPNDILIVLSGSGNSPNVVRALETAQTLGMQTFAIVAFSGGLCKTEANTTIHFPINDMQVAEDTQLIVGHMCMQWLNSNKPMELNELI
ncbi:MAG: SIS domain-containing protein [Cyanobacteria bacterium K_DeepCast_35m_m2_023]|nr:SIS domain-containing protein [Cyanobacteria bacterium K_DeepCast_35m_m2_023]